MTQTLTQSQRPRLAERLIRKRFEKLRWVTLTGIQGGESALYGKPSEGCPDAVLQVTDPNLWDVLLRRGNLGAGETFAQGLWTLPDAAQVVRLFVRNEIGHAQHG